jgi:hypothetical protein
MNSMICPAASVTSFSSACGQQMMCQHPYRLLIISRWQYAHFHVTSLVTMQADTTPEYLNSNSNLWYS